MNVHADGVGRKSLFIGLTGGIGGGKTLALSFFRGIGWEVIEADSLTRNLYEDAAGKVAVAVAARWSGEATRPDGSVDKRTLAKIVLSDDGEMRWLEELTHSQIWERAMAARGAATGKNVVFEVPLLFEAGWEERFTAVVAVFAEDTVRRARLEKRGMDGGRVEKLWRRQMPQDNKAALADFVLVNNASEGLLRKQCESLSRLLLAETW